jgi:hypothetical protein
MEQPISHSPGGSMPWLIRRRGRIDRRHGRRRRLSAYQGPAQTQPADTIQYWRRRLFGADRRPDEARLTRGCSRAVAPRRAEQHPHTDRRHCAVGVQSRGGGRDAQPPGRPAALGPDCVKTRKLSENGAFGTNFFRSAEPLMAENAENRLKFVNCRPGVRVFTRSGSLIST